MSECGMGVLWEPSTRRKGFIFLCVILLPPHTLHYPSEKLNSKLKGTALLFSELENVNLRQAIQEINFLFVGELSNS